MHTKQCVSTFGSLSRVCMCKCIARRLFIFSFCFIFMCLRLIQFFTYNNLQSNVNWTKMKMVVLFNRVILQPNVIINTNFIILSGWHFVQFGFECAAKMRLRSQLFPFQKKKKKIISYNYQISIAQNAYRTSHILMFNSLPCDHSQETISLRFCFRVGVRQFRRIRCGICQFNVNDDGTICVFCSPFAVFPFIDRIQLWLRLESIEV